MSLKTLASGGLAFVLLLGVVAVVAPVASASHLSDPTRCTCSAGLSYDRPSLQWGSEGLVFVPRINYSIRARGGNEAPPLNVSVNYEGGSSYESEDVAVPAETSFSGQKQLLTNATCRGSQRYSFSGFALEPVTLAGLVQSLIGEDQQLKGTIQMRASIEGCGFEEENRQFSFRVRDQFGELRWLGWRSAR